jgi:Co/Zn/Cd efflux system component
MSTSGFSLFIINNENKKLTFEEEINMPFSYLVYGSLGLLVLVFIIWLFSRKKK